MRTMATDIEHLMTRVINMHLDGLPVHPFGHPDAGEGDADYWQAVDDLAHHPRFNDIVEDLPFEVRVGCEGALL